MPHEIRTLPLDHKLIVVFAKTVTELASKGEVAATDAGRFYKYFRYASAEQRGAPDTKQQTDSSSAVQVSKLRKFIELGRTCGAHGVELVDRTKRIHTDLYHSKDKSRLKVTSTYEALVITARKQVNLIRAGHNRMLSDNEIFAVLLK